MIANDKPVSTRTAADVMVASFLTCKFACRSLAGRYRWDIRHRRRRTHHVSLLRPRARRSRGWPLLRSESRRSPLQLSDARADAFFADPAYAPTKGDWSGEFRANQVATLPGCPPTGGRAPGFDPETRRPRALAVARRSCSYQLTARRRPSQHSHVWPLELQTIRLV